MWRSQIRSLTADTKPAQVEGAAKNAHKVATIAASRDDAVAVPSWHGFAVLGMDRARIRLYDPSQLTQVSLSLPDFLKNFQAVLHGR